MKIYLFLSSLFFGIVATVHVVRLVQGWQVTIASWAIPMGISLPAAVICGVLCAWGLFLFSRAKRRRHFR